jgi:hypothetical protein
MVTSTEAAMQRFRKANSVSCLDISLIECPPAVQEVYSSKPARDMSSQVLWWRMERTLVVKWLPQWKAQGDDPSPFPLHVAKAGRNHLNEEITPLLTTRKGKR